MLIKKYPKTCDGIYANEAVVIFTSKCDNHCPFCIAENTRNEKTRDVGKMIETAKSVEPASSIVISGGEPFLFMKELLGFVESIREKYECITVFTSLPKTITDDFDTFKKIYALIDSLVISVNAINWKQNNAIYHAGSTHNRIMMIPRIAAVNNDKFRINLNLIRGGIQTKKALDDALDALEMLGVKNVRINEMNLADDYYVSFKEIYHRWLPDPYIYGCKRPIKLWKHRNLNIEIKYSCFKVCGFCKPTKRALRLFKKRNYDESNHGAMVIYEDGSMTRGFEGTRKND